MWGIVLNGYCDSGPCKGCDERKYLCHASCKKYEQWKHDHELVKERIRSEKVAYTCTKWRYCSKILPYQKKRYGIGINQC